MQNRWIQILMLLLTIALLVLVIFNAPMWLLLLLLVLILLLLVLWWLLGGQPESEAPTEPEEPGPFPNPDYPPEKFIVKDQVIVRGPEATVLRVVDSLSNSIQLILADSINFSELDEAVRECLGNCSQIDFSSYVIHLYKLDGSYEDVAAAIQAINRAVGRGSDVQAEPNWLSGYPWDPFGSPWDPFGSGTDDEFPAPDDLFMKQWAFTQIGLHEKRDPSSGQGVTIGVFDTSPFPEKAVAAPGGPDLSWIDEPEQLKLTLSNYPIPDPEKDEKDYSSHGLFSAGLAHALAPSANIQLIRVLGINNKGNLFYLCKGLFDFIKANAPSQRLEGQVGAAINLSLGISVPPGEAGYSLPMEVQALRDLLRAAHCAQIVVVAAAGNESANKRQPEAANLPANWPEIIGVAGSTQDKKRSCFSNQGNLAAPAGNGRSDENKQCIPANDSCGTQDCEYAVVGPVLKNSTNTGYAYWSGTSFAAPMVTGLAALVIEKGGGKLSPQDVRQIIECGARFVDEPDLGNRIIHVADTLARFEECAKEYGIDLGSPNQQTAA